MKNSMHKIVKHKKRFDNRHTNPHISGKLILNLFKKEDKIVDIYLLDYLLILGIPTFIIFLMIYL